MIDWYDREGRPMVDGMRDIEARLRDLNYKRVASTDLRDGKWVSTVWLGLNHNYGEGPPLIFETMVFRNHDDLTDLDCERYSTEAEAVAGHAAVVKRWTDDPEKGGQS